jgi:hypothetical protein
MARITHVKRAQQRYRTVPVLNDDGTQRTVPVMRANGTQKTTKHGRPVVMRVTREDRSQPLPPYTCDHCRQPIEVGTPYKHISPKSGPYGGRTLRRHAGCPTWQVWDYSSSTGARLAQIAYEAHAADEADPESVAQALRDAAQAATDLADEKEESGQNIEDGFQHETEQSMALKDLAEELRNWAQELEDAADEAEGLDTECGTCGGTGRADETVQGTSDTEDEVDLTDELADLLSKVDESPV